MITAVNGAPVKNMMDFFRALNGGSSRTASFRLMRDGTEVTIGLPA